MRPVALVSGGSRGLGAALAGAFLAAGYDVASFARTESAHVHELRERHGTRWLFDVVDALEPSAMRRFTARVLEQFGGRIDVLVNNAAVAAQGVLALAADEDIERTVGINLVAPLHLVRAVSRAMLRQGGGAIVNVSSVNALRGHAGVAVYSATKAGLDALTRSLARELGSKGIRVNSIAPGYFDGGMATELGDAARDKILRRTPLGRLATLPDLCEAVLFLCSDRAAFITGQTLVVDGGLTC